MGAGRGSAAWLMQLTGKEEDKVSFLQNAPGVLRTGGEAAVLGEMEIALRLRFFREAPMLTSA